jgi:nucleotide-binding universal stress UspA family protein
VIVDDFRPTAEEETMETRTFRVLAPMEPEEDAQALCRLLQVVFPPPRTLLRRIFVSPPVATEYFIPEMYEAYEEILNVEAEARMAALDHARRLSRPLEIAGYAVEADVAAGSPITEVLREMAAWGADMTVMRMSRQGGNGERVGGMTSALARHGTTPLLLYRNPPPPGYAVRKILIATDFSEASRVSADWGMALAALTGAEAHLLYVLARHGGRSYGRDELFRVGTEEIDRWRKRLSPALGRPVTDAHVVSAAFPAEGVLDFANEGKFDLVALAGTGRSPVSTLLLGSNARAVLRASAVPVLLVPAESRVSPSAFLARVAAPATVTA